MQTHKHIAAESSGSSFQICVLSVCPLLFVSFISSGEKLSIKFAFQRMALGPKEDRGRKFTSQKRTD